LSGRHERRVDHGDYRLASVSAEADGEHHVWLTSRISGRTCRIPIAVARRLAEFRRFQPLPSRTRRPWKSDDVEDWLHRLAAKGFLLSRHELQSRFAYRHRIDSNTTPRAAIATIAIPTADRPHVLLRCIESYASNQAVFGRSTRLLVSDDSRSPAPIRVRAERIAAHSGLRLDWLTRRMRAAFARRLAQELGLDLAVIRFGLLGDPDVRYSLGANRNSLILATLGECILNVDDDTVCIPSSTESDNAGLSGAISSAFDPLAYRFFEQRRDALGAPTPTKIDVLAPHEDVLGRSLPGAFASAPDMERRFDDADAQALSDIWSGRGRVRLSANGFRGRSGQQVPARFIDPPDRWRSRLLRSERFFDAATRSQAMSAGVSCVTLGNRSYLSGMFFGLDNREIAPPFFPVLRASDVLFGRTYRLICPDTYLAHLPSSLVHDPIHSRPCLPAVLWRQVGVELAYVVGDLVAERAGASGSRAPDLGLRDIGGHLTAIGTAHRDEFIEIVRAKSIARTVTRIRRLEASLQQHGERPRFWAERVRRHVRHLTTAVRSAEQALPTDVRGSGDGWVRAQRLIGRFGALLIAWPDLLEATRRLEQKGSGLLNQRPSSACGKG
jgi:hypothetical protein